LILLNFKQEVKYFANYDYAINIMIDTNIFVFDQYFWKLPE